tara:strand:- start:161 stop:472 length:312 start_codon:yes stop_codon:yes gene_type:complete
MPRPYSDSFILGLEKADERILGVQLAKLCLKANLPIKYVAQGVGTSRQAVHAWFRGGPMKYHNHQKVKKFMSQVERGLADGILPASDLACARVFIESDNRLEK